MSLLPATSHRDPTNPYWATAAGASGISTIAAGSGISVSGGSGPTATITNSGVRAIVAGAGITTSGTNSVTITNGGVTNITAGQGITVSASTGSITISNNGTADIAPLATVSPQATQGGVPVSFGTFTLGKSYQYAEGYGFIQTTGGLFASPPQITVYLSSGTTALPLDLTKSVGYILSPVNSGRTNLTGWYYDLSGIKHYDPAGFTSITLTWLTDTGGTGVAFSPVGSTAEVTNSTTADIVTTKLTTARTGAAGFKFFTNI